MASTKLKLSFTLLLFLIPFFILAQELENYLHLEGTSNDRAQAIEVDASDNIYMAGFYSGTIDFDPSGSVNNQTSNGNADIFLTKYDALGNFQWVVSIGGAEFDEAKSIAIDGLGNIYLTGRFRQTADFDPSANTFALTSHGEADGFVAKYDVNGLFQWAFQIGGILGDESMGISFQSGLIIVGGQFQSTADFDPSVANSSLTSTGSYDIFIAAYDDAGAYQWAVNIGGPSGDGCYGLDTDASGNTYVTGYFSGTVDFDPGIGTTNYSSVGNADAYLCKLDNAGAFQWAFPLGGTGFFSDEGRDVAVDGSGNIIITGRFVGTADFDPAPGSAPLTSFGVISGFLAKYDPTGNYQWAIPLRNVNFASSAVPQSVTTDPVGDIYLTGGLNDEIDFDPSAAEQKRTSAGGTDIFLAKYNASGNYQWAINSGGTLSDEAFDVVAGASQVHIAGYFQGTMDVDPGTNTTNLTSGGATDLLMTQFNGQTLPLDWAGFEGSQTFSGIRLEWITSQEFHNHHFTVQRSIDGVLFTEIGLVLSLGNSTQGHFYSFFDASPLVGLNYYRIQQTDINGHSSYSPTIMLRVGKSNWNWSFFPNPSTDFLTYEFNGSMGEFADIQILNGAGSLVWRIGRISPGSGAIPVSDWPAGNYYIYVEGKGGKKYTKEVVVY